MKSLKTLGLAMLALALATPAWATPVPEIDPSLIQSGLTVLVGGVLILMGRRRK